MAQCDAQGAEEPARRVDVRRPARLPPLAGGTLPNPSSSGTHKAHLKPRRQTPNPSRVMLPIRVLPSGRFSGSGGGTKRSSSEVPDSLVGCGLANNH